MFSLECPIFTSGRAIKIKKKSEAGKMYKGKWGKNIYSFQRERLSKQFMTWAIKYGLDNSKQKHQQDFFCTFLKYLGWFLMVFIFCFKSLFPVLFYCLLGLPIE